MNTWLNGSPTSVTSSLSPTWALCCIYHQMHLPSECIWCQNVPTLRMHMMPKCAKFDSLSATPRTFWQKGAERNQTPHQMGNLGRYLDLIYTYLSHSHRPWEWRIKHSTVLCHMQQGGWITSTVDVLAFYAETGKWCRLVAYQIPQGLSIPLEPNNFQVYNRS